MLHAAIVIATLCSWMQFSVAVHIGTLPIVVKQLSKLGSFLDLISQSAFDSDDKYSQSIVECLETYQPMLDSLTEEFQSGYEGCLKTSKEEREAADNAVQGERTKLESTVGFLCAGFEKCNKEEEADKYFQCTMDQAKIAHTQSRGIASDASKTEGSLVYSHESIIYNQKKCSDELTTEYKTKTDKVNADLQNCIGASLTSED